MEPLQYLLLYCFNFLKHGFGEPFFFFFYCLVPMVFPTQEGRGGHAYSKMRKGEFRCGLQFKNSSSSHGPICPRGCSFARLEQVMGKSRMEK